MSALRGLRRGRGRRLWVVGATLVAAAAFGAVFVAASGAAPPTCPTPGNFEIDGDMNQNTCTPPANDWDTPNIGVQSTTQGGTYSTSGKDGGDPSTWTSTGSTPDKTNFAQAYATSRVVNGHFFVFVAWERTSTTGTQGYAIEITNAGSNTGADGTPQPNRGGGGAVFYITSQGAAAPQFNSACSYTSQSDYGTTCTNSDANVTMAINTASMSDPLNGTTQPAGGFFEVALDVTGLTGITPSCPGTAANAVYLRSITGQAKNGNLKGYMAPLEVAPDSTCVPPPITTTATPGGSTNLPGASQHDTVSVNDGTNAGVGSVKFFLCSPAEVTANGGDCSANGTQVGSAVTLDGNGAGTSDSVNGGTTPSDLAPGKYCWRAEFTPTSGDHHFLAGSHTNSGSECFTIIKASPAIVTNASTTGGGVVGTGTTCDSATLSNGISATGTITFKLTAPDSSVSTVGSVTVNGNGTYQSPSCPLLTQVGTYTWHATYSGDSLNNGAVDNGADESITSVKASPAIVTNASTTGGGVVGTGTTCDSATLSGSYNGTGTITFKLTAPDTTTSTVGSVTVNGDGTYQSPSCPLLTEVGTYTWSATYSGDSLNNGAVDNGKNESITSVKASPSITTDASTTGDGVVGTDTTCDSATLSGSYNGSGTITFKLTAPDTTTSTVGSVTVTGNGTYKSPSCPPLTEVGTYTWSATYSGDSLNNGAVDNGDNETVTSSPTTPSITTVQDPASGSVGDTYMDKATLSGTFQGSGSITWTLYPNNDCSGKPLGTDTQSVDGNGNYETPNGVTVNAAGTYYWVAHYSGDSNNGEATSGCADEPITVHGAAIHIKKTADKAQVSAGDQIGFTMTVWNSGDGDAKGVTLTDQLPANSGLSWTIADTGSGWGEGGCSISQSNVLTCGPATVPANTTQEDSTYTVHIVSGTDTSTGGDCTGTNGVVDNTGDVSTSNDGSDSSEAKICVAAPAIHILKTADAAQVKVGEPIGFTMTVYNSGPGDAKGVTLNDVLPTTPGLSWSIDKTGTGWGDSCSISAGVLKCGPVTVPTGTTLANSTFTVHITSATTAATAGDCPETGVVRNTGSVTTTNDGSGDSEASTCVQAMVDLSITKSGTPATQHLGDGNITWTIVVTNNGPNGDSGVVVSDPMPAGNTFVSATTTKGSCTGGAILNCTIGDMAAGQSVTITLVTTPSQEGTQTNTATVAGNRPETNTGNNSATATVQVTGVRVPPTPCIAVSKVTPKQLFVGRKTTLTIHVTQGGNAVKGIHVRITGAKINVRTGASNGKGVIKHTLKMKKAGILVFSPIASKRCNTQRVGVTNVFTPPVTG